MDDKEKKIKEIVTKVENLVLNANRQLRPFAVAAYLNVEYIRGNQNISVAKDLSITKREPNNTTYTERKIFNRMSPIYLARLGLLSANMPLPGFKQNGTSPGRFIDYTEGNRFVNDFMTDVCFKTTFHNRVSIHADLHGLVWLKSGIDWTAGEKIGEYDVTIKNKNGEEIKVKQKFYEGRPWLEVCPMDEVLVDNYYNTNQDSITELVHRRLFTLSYIKARWGIDATEDSRDTLGGTNPLQIVKNKNSGNMLNADDDERCAYAYEYYHRADAEFPQGIYCVIINHKLVTEISELPYENGKNGKRLIPFDCIRLMDLPNYLVGPTVYNQIIPIQDTYNATKNRVLEYINRLGIAQFYVWEGSLVDQNALSNRPGAIFRLKRSGKKPEPVTHNPLGTEFINYLITLENDMLVTSGVSPITALGQAKSAMRTDGVVDRITESDQNKLEHAVDNIGAAYLRVFKKILYIEQMRERLLKEEIALAVPKIDNYMSKYRLESVDVEQIQIVNREFLMKNDQYLTGKFQQAMTLGIYNPQSNLQFQQKVSILEKLQLGSIIDTLDPVEIETSQIVREEHEEMESGQEPEVEEWHVHAQHVYEHNLYRQSPIMRSWRKFDNAKYLKMKDILDAHINKHKEFLNKMSNSFGNAFSRMGNSSPKPYSSSFGKPSEKQGDKFSDKQ